MLGKVRKDWINAGNRDKKGSGGCGVKAVRAVGKTGRDAGQYREYNLKRCGSGAGVCTARRPQADGGSGVLAGRRFVSHFPFL